MKIDFLKSLPVFSSWTRDSIRKLTPFLKEKKYRRGQLVIKEGDDYDGVSFTQFFQFNM
jgi:hypothetical protein